jgi:patatin-like phospholipase/acyl hydrolase
MGLYRDHGAEIFSSSWLRKVVSLFFGAEYSPQNLEYYLKQQFGDRRLADAVTGLLITAYEMRAGEAWFFSREGARKKPERNYLLWEVARATSAAPTYFPPAKLPGNGGEGALVDGGMFANNPGLCAWVDGHEQVNATSDVMMLSLGTGSVPHPVTFNRARRWGKVLWAQPAMGAFLDGQSDTAEYQLKQLLNPAYYLRLQVTLPVQNERMDDASQGNIQALQDAAAQMLSDPAISQRLTDFCDRLTGQRALVSTPKE